MTDPTPIAADKPTSATWNISLTCECPSCKEYVDLLDYADFWDGRSLDIAEYDTERSKNVSVCCPDCNHEFEVCCEY